jgi:hypothetical protein
MRWFKQKKYCSIRIAEPCEFGGIDGYHWNITDTEKDETIAIAYSRKNAQLIIKALNK